MYLRRARLGSVAAFVLIGIIALAGFATPAHAQGYLFNQMAGFHGTWQTSGGLYYSPAIAQGDFNGDGRLDFAVIDLYQNTTYNGSGYFVDIYLAQPDGTYKLSSSYPASYGTTIAAGDVNGDGKLDLVYMGGSNLVTVQLGNGNGTFQNPVYSFDTTTASPESVILGDFNKDGKLDIAYADPSAAGVFVQLGNGDGSFQSAVLYSLSNCEPGQVIAADFNKDSKLDLAVACAYGPGSTYVLLGNGDGTFGTAVNYVVGASGIAAADLNKDGNLDLIVSGSPNGLSVLLGNGDGTFQTPISTNVVGNLGGNLVVADLNGDGKLDVAMAGGWVGIVVLFGNGNGTFKSPIYAYGNLNVSGAYSGLLSGDYNLDGKIDLVAVPYFENGDSFTVLTNNGDGTFGSESDYLAATDATAVVTGDFNGDGIPDLAVSDYSSHGQISVYLGQGNGKFSAPLLSAAAFLPSAVVTGDFNHDGKLDLATLGNGNFASIFLGLGTGKFAKAVSYATGATPSAIAAADLNKDGNLDLVISDSGDSNVTVLLGNSNGTFQAAKYSNAGSTCESVAVADFNSDGIPDLVLGCGASGISAAQVMLGNGDGTFQAPLPLTLPSSIQIYTVNAADLRGNGVTDVILGILNQNANLNCAAYCALVYLGNGDGTFSATPVTNDGPVGSTVAFADFDGDGKLDMAVTGLNSFVALMLGNGDGTFQPALQYQVPHADANIYTSSLAIADFNADGSPDLAVTSWGGTNDAGYLTVLLSNPVAVFSSAKLNFGKVTVNSTSTLKLTITNQSPTKLTVKGITITGTAAADYSQTNTCGSLMAGYANCVVSVTFKPSVTGLRSAKLSLADSATGPVRAIALSGTGK